LGKDRATDEIVLVGECVEVNTYQAIGRREDEIKIQRQDDATDHTAVGLIRLYTPFGTGLANIKSSSASVVTLHALSTIQVLHAFRSMLVSGVRDLVLTIAIAIRVAVDSPESIAFDLDAAEAGIPEAIALTRRLVFSKLEPISAAAIAVVGDASSVSTAISSLFQ
jgi:hypothetical protein